MSFKPNSKFNNFKQIYMKKLINQAAIAFLLIILLSGCAEVIPIEECVKNEPYGFLSGLLHGIIAPASFIISLFDDTVAMYAVNNNGAWYDLGFVLGAGILFVGGGSRAKRR